MESTIIWSETGRKNGADYAHSQHFVKHDGGRNQYFQGDTGDCVTRAIAIATGIDYKEVYDTLFGGIRHLKKKGRSNSKVVKRLRKSKPGTQGTTPRNGVDKKVYEKYLFSLGWVWVPTMFIGQGCKVHLRGDELPKGRLIVSVSRHITCMIDGVLYDSYDCTRSGDRCVYGYYYHPNEQGLSAIKPVQEAKPKVLKAKPTLKKLTDWHKDKLVYMIDSRLDTILDDPASADSFESFDSLTLLKDKIKTEVNLKFTDEEKDWLSGEIGNSVDIQSFGIIAADKLINYIVKH